MLLGSIERKAEDDELCWTRKGKGWRGQPARTLKGLSAITGWDTDAKVSSRERGGVWARVWVPGITQRHCEQAIDASVQQDPVFSFEPT